MRRILSVVCAIAVFVSAFCGALSAVTANNSSFDINTLPTASTNGAVAAETGFFGSSIVGGEVLDESLTGLIALPSIQFNNKYVAIGTSINNPAYFTGRYNLETPTGNTASADMGIMYYVDVSVNTQATVPAKLQVFIDDDKTTNTAPSGWSTNFGAKDGRYVYLLEDNTEVTNTWTRRDLPADAQGDFLGTDYTDANGIILPAGFKGYVYLPSECFKAWKDISMITAAVISSYGDQSYVYKLSAPMVVEGFSADETRFNGDEKVIDLDTNLEVTPSGGTVTPPVDISTLPTASTNGAVQDTEMFGTSIVGGEVLPESLTGLTALPSIKFNNKLVGASVSINNPAYITGRYNLETKTSAEASATMGIMYYIDASANDQVTTPAKLHVFIDDDKTTNATKTGWSAGFTKKEGRYVYLLEDNTEVTNSWTRRDLPANSEGDFLGTSYTDADGIILPASFKGYVYIPSECFKYWNGISMIAAAVVSSYGDQSRVYQLSAPMVVEGFSADETRFNGDEKVIDLDTNEEVQVGTPDDEPVDINTLPTASTNGAVQDTVMFGTGIEGGEVLPGSLTGLIALPSIKFKNKPVGTGVSVGNPGYMTGRYNLETATDSEASATMGIMYYVDVSANDQVTTPAKLHVFIDDDKTTNATKTGWSAGFTKKEGRYVYLLDDNTEVTNSWTRRDLPADANGDFLGTSYTDADGIILPAGFKGYVYIPSESFKYWTGISMIAAAVVSSYGDQSLVYQLSAPMVVNGFKADETRFNGDEKVINLDTNEEVETFDGPGTGGGEPGPGTGGEEPGPGTGGEEPGPGTGGEEPGPGTGGEEPDDRVEPDYDLPAYTGTQMDYSNFKIAKAWVARFKEKVFVGEGFKGTGVSVKAGATGVAVDSLVGITKYPAIKLTASADDATLTVSTNHDGSKTSGATEAMIYVKVPEGKNAAIRTTWNFTRPDGSFASGAQFARTVKLLGKDAAKWTTVAVDAYWIPLPAGFEGYVRYSYNCIGTWQDGQLVFPDQGYKLIETRTEISGIEYTTTDNTVAELPKKFNLVGLNSGEEFYVSAPILMDELSDDHLQTVTFVEKETKVARNIVSGKIYEYVPEPNYDLPAYTGKTLDYSLVKVAKAWVAKFKEPIYVGKGFMGDGVAVQENTSGVAVDSLIGITKYPSIKLTATANDTDLSVYTRHDGDKCTGATEAMIYVKVPEGKDAAIRTTWNFIRPDGSFASGAQFARSVQIIGKDQKKWSTIAVDAYWIPLPTGFEGYVRYSYDSISTWKNGEIVFVEKDYKLIEALTQVTSIVHRDKDNYATVPELPKKFDVVGFDSGEEVFVSAPILMDEFDPNEYLQTVAFPEKDTKAARDIFTGEVFEYIPEPDYDIPMYNGTPVDYDTYKFMDAWVARFKKEEVHIGKGYMGEGLIGQNTSNVVASESLIGITKYPFVNLTANGNGWVGMSTRHEPGKYSGADEAMYYVKVPAGKNYAVRTAWNFTRADGSFGSGSQFARTVKIMAKGENKWKEIAVDAYWVPLPEGFEGYVRYKYSYLATWKNGEIVTPDSTYTLIETLTQLTEINYRDPENLGTVAELPKKFDIVNPASGTQVLVSAPILLGNVTIESADDAVRVNKDPNAARDIFTGEVKKREDYVKPLVKGEILKAIPEATTDLSCYITDKTNLHEGRVTLTWDAFEGAKTYELRIFKNISSASGFVYSFFSSITTTETTAEITGLDMNTRYSIVLYAFDAKGNTVAIYDYIPLSTAGVKKPTSTNTPSVDVDEPTDTEEPTGLSTVALIAIIAGGVVVLAAAGVVVFIVLKKKNKKTSK